LVPLIKAFCDTYLNKTLGTRRPTPRYDIVGWVQKDGSAPPTPGKLDLNDKLDF
jgi:hypothetical protein